RIVIHHDHDFFEKTLELWCHRSERLHRAHVIAFRDHLVDLITDHSRELIESNFLRLAEESEVDRLWSVADRDVCNSFRGIEKGKKVWFTSHHLQSSDAFDEIGQEAVTRVHGSLDLVISEPVRRRLQNCLNTI